MSAAAGCVAARPSAPPALDRAVPWPTARRGAGHGLTVGGEQHLRIVGRIHDRRIEPDRHNDAQVVRLLLGDVAGPNGVKHTVGDRRLHRAHQDVGVQGVVDGDLADHQRRRPHLDVRVEDREHPGVALGLVTEQVGDRVADGTVEFADHDLRLRRAPGLVGLHQRLAGPQQDSSAGTLALALRLAFLRHRGCSRFTSGPTCRRAGPRGHIIPTASAAGAPLGSRVREVRV